MKIPSFDYGERQATHVLTWKHREGRETNTRRTETREEAGKKCVCFLKKEEKSE